jgi:uncharacterized metal-binding protein
MSDKGSCCCTADTTTVMACSGGSNVGQMTNEVAKRLDQAGLAKFFCMAGVGGQVSGIIESVKGSDKVLVVDGCSVACAKKMMDLAGLEDYEYVVITDLGIEKKHVFDMPEGDLQLCENECRSKLGANAV